MTFIDVLEKCADMVQPHLPALKALTVSDLIFALTVYRKIRWRIHKWLRKGFGIITAGLIFLLLNAYL